MYEFAQTENHQIFVIPAQAGIQEVKFLKP